MKSKLLILTLFFSLPLAAQTTVLTSGLSIDASGNLMANFAASGGGTSYQLTNGLRVDASGNLMVNVAVGGSSTAQSVQSLASDPGTCTNAEIWYNTTSNLYKICPNGVATTIGSGSSVWSSLTNPTGNLALNMGTGNTTTFTVPDQGSSPIAAFYFNATGVSTTDTSTVVKINGAGRQNELIVTQGANTEFQVGFQPGPQGEIVVGGAIAFGSLGQSPYAKFVAQSETAGHTVERLIQTSTSATGTELEVNNATTGTGFNFATFCAGASATSGLCGSGTVVASLRGDGYLTAAGANLTAALTLPITGSTQCLHVNSSGVVSGTGSDCGSGGGTTTNALTMNNGGAGAASGSTFNGSAAVTLSYNTIGAAAANAATTVNGQTCTLSSTCAVESATSGQVAISGGSGSALTGAVDLTYSTHTFSGTANTIFDLSAATGTAAFKLPQTTSNTASAAGVLDYDTSNSNYHGYDGADSILALFPTASVPATGHLVAVTVSSGKVTLSDGGAVPATSTTVNGNTCALGSTCTLTLDQVGNLAANATNTASGAFTWTLAGTQPSSVSGIGTNATPPFALNAVTGGNTSGTATTAGVGSSATLTCGGTGGTSNGGTNVIGGAGGSCTFAAGSGGASTGTAANSNGGSFGVLPGPAGTGGSGAAGKAGTFIVAQNGSVPSVNTAGDILELFAGSTMELRVAPNGSVLSAGGVFESSGAVGAVALCGGSGACAASSTADAHAGNTSVVALGTSSNSSSAMAAPVYLGPGILTNATPNAAALEGAGGEAYGYLKGTAVANVGDIVCATTTAFTVTDCPITPGVNIIGIATTTSNPIVVQTSGLMLVKLDGAITALGDTICMGTTTAGLGHDQGSGAVCTTAGTTIGVAVADSGTISVINGFDNFGSVAMSTTLVLVQLRIGK